MKFYLSDTPNSYLSTNALAKITLLFRSQRNIARSKRFVFGHATPRRCCKGTRAATRGMEFFLFWKIEVILFIIISFNNNNEVGKIEVDDWRISLEANRFFFFR